MWCEEWEKDFKYAVESLAEDIEEVIDEKASRLAEVLDHLCDLDLGDRDYSTIKSFIHRNSKYIAKKVAVLIVKKLLIRMLVDEQGVKSVIRLLKRIEKEHD